MAILIGSTEPGFEDPVGLMTACHRRIERFLGVLCRIVQDRRGGELNEREAEAFQTALRYFRDAAPHHTEDEERGLFPELARVDSDVAIRLAGLEKEHRRAERLHADVDQIGREWLRTGTLAEPQATAIQAALEELTELYRDHIRIEEEQLFPLANRILPAGVMDVIGRQMAASRGVTYIPKRMVAIGEKEQKSS